MNGYVFYLLFRDPKNTSDENRRLEKCFYKDTPGSKRLDPNTANAIVYPSSASILDVAENTPVFRSNIVRGARWVKERKIQRKLTQPPQTVPV
jgi:hypothetical protein